MKGIKLDARSIGLGMVAGSLLGGLGGYFFAHSRSRREYTARLDAAVAEVKAHYARPVIPKGPVPESNRPTWASTIEGTLNKPVKIFKDPAPDPLEGIGDGSLDLEPADETAKAVSEGAGPEGGDGLHALAGVPEGGPVEPDDPDHPFEITEAAFGELADEGFQQISVTYFVADKVLVDDREQPIRDKLGTIGTDNPTGYSPDLSNDPHIRYVRNRRLEVDFEILLDARSYAETVLGYGAPGKRREASPAATTAD